MTWLDYVGSITEDNASVIARRIGLSQASVSRWSSARPKPESVAAFARAYDRPVLEAFIAAGFMTSEEAGQPPAAPIDYTQLTNRDLVDLIEDRLLGREQSDGRKPEAEKSTQHGEVIPFRDLKKEGRQHAARMDDEPEDEG